jgi:serine/threonine protein kinase
MTRPTTAPGHLVARRYRLESQIGGGGMGTVWLARDELLGRPVAVKQVLSPAGVSAEEADQQRQRALREGRIAARLSHPHAISVYDVALESGQPWLVMEYLPSRSLAAVLTDDGTLRVDQVAQIGAQVADALAATHAAGIVHRDVKPANILIGEGGRVEGLVKITDFGISHASGDITLTQTGQITGTPAFLAPEVAQGRPMTEASDVFSLGATLYTCLEGTPPFGMEDNALGMLHRVAGGQIVPPRRSGSLTQPLQKMLAADPADRPAMPQVRDELAQLAAGRDGDTTTILLARTDLRSDAPGRTRTASFAAGAGPGTPAPAAAATPAPTPPSTLTSAPAPVDRPSPPPAPAARTPDRPPPALPREGGRRRGRAGWVTAALVAAVLAGLIAFWAIDPLAHGGSTAQGTSPAEPSAAGTSATPTSEGSPTPDEQPADGTQQDGGHPQDTAAASESLRARDVERAVRDFFTLLPDDTEEAYALTSPGFQSRHPYEGFDNFWSDFDDVRLRNIQAQDGSTTAAVEIEYVSEETRQVELHTITVTVGEDGRVRLDSDDFVRVVG